jgi:hypothetical protein
MAALTGRTTERAQASEQATAGPTPAAADMLTAGMRLAGAGQDAAWRIGLETVTRSQRMWFDQWTRWTEAGLAWLTPVTAHQIDERLDAAERGAARREAEIRTRLDSVAADLHEAQQEAGRQQARALRDAAREQQAAQAAADEALRSLDRRLDALTKAQTKQLEELKAAMNEQEQRLRAALGARVRTAVSSIDAATPEDLEPLRDQVAALARATTATRKEVAEFGRELHEESHAGEHSAAPSGQPGGSDGESKPSDT